MKCKYTQVVQFCGDQIAGLSSDSIQWDASYGVSAYRYIVMQCMRVDTE